MGKTRVLATNGNDAMGKAGKPFEDGMIGFDPVTDHHCCEAPDVGRKDG